MVDFLLAALLLLILGLAIFYVRRAKKRGCHCVGCPDGATCPYAKKGGCGRKAEDEIRN